MENVDEETDSLIKHCLKIICCSGTVPLHCEMKYQLPSSKGLHASAEIMMETKMHQSRISFVSMILHTWIETFKNDHR